MSFLVSMALPFLVALLTSMITAWMWRHELASPIRFSVFSCLILLGLHRVIQAIAELWKLFQPSGYFLEYGMTSTAIELVERQLTIEAMVVSFVLVAVGVPLLYALRKALVR